MALLANKELQFLALSADTVRVRVDDEPTCVDLLFDAIGDIVGAKTTTRCRGDQV